MAKALKCDRCGAFYDYIKGLRNYRIQDMNEKNFDKTVDICPDCYETFVKWLTGKREQEEVGTGELYPGEFESRHYDFEQAESEEQTDETDN